MAHFKIAHLTRRGGIYYFRASIPQGLVEKFGCREIKLSLKTRDPQIARLRCRACSSTFERLVAGVGGMSGLTQEQITTVLRGFLERELSKSVEAAFLLPQDEQIDLVEQLVHFQEALSDMREKLAVHAFGPGCRSQARALIESMGLTSDEVSGLQFNIMCAGILRAQIENYRVIVAMLEGKYDEAVPHDPLFKGVEVPPLPAWPGLSSGTATETVSSLAEKFVTLKSKHDWVPKTRNENQRVLDWFEEIAGPDKPIKAVSNDDVRDFRDILVRLPANFAKIKKHAGQRLKEIAEKHDGEPLAIKTARKYFENLKSFLKWCVQEGYLEKIPGQTLRIGTKPNALDARLPFSSQQLKQLFASPQYTGHLSHSVRTKPGEMLVKDGKYWVPLIGLFTGMRLGEIVQLQCADVKQEDGVWFFDISKTEGEAKQLKTASSQRVVPLHPTLVALGFLDMVMEATKAHPKERLFADIEPGADGYFSHNFSKYFSRYSKAIGIKTPKTAFHSLRHNFKDALVKANVSDSHIKALLGHADDSVTASYGSKIMVSVLSEDIGKIKYEVDFEPLLPSA